MGGSGRWGETKDDLSFKKGDVLILLQQGMRSKSVDQLLGGGGSERLGRR